MLQDLQTSLLNKSTSTLDITLCKLHWTALIERPYKLFEFESPFDNAHINFINSFDNHFYNSFFSNSFLTTFSQLDIMYVNSKKFPTFLPHIFQKITIPKLIPPTPSKKKKTLFNLYPTWAKGFWPFEVLW